jgi:hypothetical protein
MADAGQVSVQFVGDTGPLEDAIKRAERLAQSLTSKVGAGSKQNADDAEYLAGAFRGISDELKNVEKQGVAAWSKNQQGVKQVAAEASRANTVFANLAKTAAAFGLALTAQDIARRIAQFGTEMIRVGDQMSDLNVLTGISTRTFALLRGELEASGSSIESFATSVNMLMRNLADGVEETDRQGRALKRLGMTSEEAIAGMSDPDGFLLEFARKLAAVENQSERNRIAFDLMGRAGVQQVPALMALAKGTDELTGAAVAGYTALGNLADGFVKAKTEMQNFAAGVLANTIKDLKVLAIGATLAAESLAKLMAMGGAPGMKEMAERLETFRLESLQGPQSHQEVPAPYVPGADPRKTKEAADKLKAYTENLQKQIIALRAEEIALNSTEAAGQRFRMMQEALIELGPAGAKSVQGLIDKVVSLGAYMDVMQFDKGLKQQITALEGQRIAVQKGESAALRFNLTQQAMVKFGGILTASTIDLIDAIVRESESLRQAELEAKRHADTVKMLDQDYGELASASEDLAKRFLDEQKAIEAATKAFNDMRIAQRQTAADADSAEWLTAGEDVYKIQAEAAKKSAEQTLAVYERLWSSLENGIDQTLNGIMTGQQSFSEGMKNLARNMILSFMSEFTKLAVLNPIKNLLFGGMEGYSAAPTFGGMLAPLIGGIFGAATGGVAPAMKQGGRVPNIGANISPMLAAAAQSWPQYAAGGGVVPARLHQGEYVLNKNAATAVGMPALDYINRSAQLPRQDSQQSAAQPVVQIMGDIIPRSTLLNKEDVIKITTNEAMTRGRMQQAIEMRWDRG